MVVTSATNTVTVNSVDSEIVHDNLSGFVPNEDIAATSTTLADADQSCGKYGYTIEHLQSLTDSEIFS